MAAIRFLFRVLFALAFAVASLLAVLDASRTVAASRLVLTSLGQSWQDAWPSGFEAARATITAHVPLLWDPFLLWFLHAPGFAVFLVLALVFQAAGTRRRRWRSPHAA